VRRLAAIVLGIGLCALAPSAWAAAPSIVYLDFSDGTETLTYAATDDAATNRSSVGGASPYPAFTWPTISTGVESRATVIERMTRRVHELFLPYNVLITLTRPSQPPFTTVMIGGGPRELGLDLSFAGVAYMDCGNKQDSNVVFAFPTNVHGDEHGLVVTIAQEAAHGFGLEHTITSRDLMHPLLSPEQASFLDAESAILGDRLCGNSTQNSHLKLLEAVGPWRGDSKPLDLGSGLDRAPPLLSLREPAPGATVAQPLPLLVEASDDSGIDRVTLQTPDGTETVVRRAPFGFSLAGFPPGPLAFTITAHDRSGNSASLTREVTVTETADLPTGCQTAGRSGGARAGGRPGTHAGAAGLVLLCVIGLGIARRRNRHGSCCSGPSLPL
jgi:hypothetical protein